MGNGPALPDAIPAVADGTRIQSGEYVQVYRSTLADTGTKARVFILDSDAPVAAASAFERAGTAWEASSHHPGITPVRARGDHPRPWLAVADMAGQLLSETDLPVDARRRVLADIAEGLRSTHHEGYQHLAVTPGHIWVIPGVDSEGVISVAAGEVTGSLDWALDTACQTAVDGRSDPYTPPELRSGPDGVDDPARADVYSLSAVAYEALTGTLPDSAECPETERREGAHDTQANDRDHEQWIPAPSRADSELSGIATALLSRGLANEPEARFPSMYALKRALVFGSADGPQRVAGGVSTATALESETASPSERADNPRNPDTEAESDSGRRPSRRAMLGALGAGVVGAAAGGVWLFTGGSDGGTGAADSLPMPDAAFEFMLRPREVAVTYLGDDGPNADNVFLRSGALPGGELAWPRGSDADGRGPIEAGETFAFDVGGEYDVSVVWAGDETSEVLATRSGPVDPRDPTIGNVSQSQYDGQNTGFTQTTVPTPGAREHWRFEAGDRIESSPVVVDGVVYVGSNDGSVYAVDAATGTELWAVRTGFRVRASPTVAPLSAEGDGDGEARSVFVGNTNGTLYALNARDGSIRWDVSVGDEFVSSPGVVSLADDPGPLDSTVVFAGGLGGFSAFDAAEGRELWSFETGGYVSAPGILPPTTESARDRTTVFAAGGDDTVYALDAHNGQEIWTVSLEGVATAPTVARPFDAPLSGPGYTVFFGSGLAGSRGLSALDAADGTLQWSVRTEADVVSSPAIVGEDKGMADGGTIFAGDSGGGVYAVDAWTGDLRWTTETDDGITAALTVADTSGTEWSSGRGNTLFLGSLDGNVYGFDTVTGSGRWAFTTGASVKSSPTIVDGALYVGNRDGHLYALAELQRDELGDQE